MGVGRRALAHSLFGGLAHILCLGSANFYRPWSKQFDRIRPHDQNLPSILNHWALAMATVHQLINAPQGCTPHQIIQGHGIPFGNIRLRCLGVAVAWQIDQIKLVGQIEIINLPRTAWGIGCTCQGPPPR